MQAIMNNANANWTAPAFVSLSIYTAIIIKTLNLRRLLICTITFNNLIFFIFVFAGDIGNLLSLPQNPYKRIYGSKQIANLIKADHCDKKQVYLFDDRKTAATMTYYLKNCYKKVEYYSQSENMENYYHMEFPFTEGADYVFFSTRKDTAPKNYLEVENGHYSLPNSKLKITVKTLVRNPHVK